MTKSYIETEIEIDRMRHENTMNILELIKTSMELIQRQQVSITNLSERLTAAEEILISHGLAIRSTKKETLQ